MVQILLTDKQFSILKYVGVENYILAVAKLCDVTYSHVYKMMLHYEKIGLVNMRKTIHRKRMVTLTKKGIKVLELYFQVYNLLKEGGVK